MNTIIKELKQYKKEAILAPTFKMLEAFFDLFVPLVVAQIIDVGINSHNHFAIYKGIGVLIMLAIVGIICSITAQYFAAKAAVKTASQLRVNVYKQIQSFSFNEIDQIGTSTLITRLTSDINQIQNGVNMSLRLLLRSPFIIFGSFVMAYIINPQISMIFMITIVVLSIIIYSIMKNTNPRYKLVQEKLDHLLLLTRENLTGVRVIRAFSNEQEEVAGFKTLNATLNQNQRSVGMISSLMNPLTYVIINLAIIAILYYGSVKVDQGIILSGSVVALVNYINQILVELIKLADTIVLISKTIASSKRVEDILNTTSSMVYGTKEDVEDNNYLLTFNHVSLTYQNAQEACLTDISFKLRAGESLGIIGSTGSGKTSLAHLITRFYDASEGEVLLGDSNIKKYSKASLTKNIHIVMQKAQLFSGTIKSNLLSANKNATDDELLQVLKIAQADNILQSKDAGLDAVVEQGGRNFSGGQRQRLSIARALVGKCKILILDDSSSALDYVTDANLRNALAKLNMSTIIISQRTSSVSHCDQILVLEDGMLVGKGTHDELLKTCNVYKEIDQVSSRGNANE